MIARGTAVLLLVGALLGLISVPAEAQAPLPRGRPRLQFEGGEDKESREALTLTANVSESRDDNLIAGQSGAPNLIDPRFQTGSFFTQAGASVFYGRRNDKMKFSTGGNIASNYYPDISDVATPSFGGQVDYTWMRRGTTVVLSQGASRTPYFLFGVFPSISNPDTALPDQLPPVATSQDLGVFSRPARNYATGARLTQSVGRKSSITATYGYNRNDLGTGWTNQQGQAVGIQYSEQISRSLSISGNYGAQPSKYELNGIQNKFLSQDFAAGIDYIRPLSATRRLHLSGNAGSTRMSKKVPVVAIGTTPVTDITASPVLADATFYDVGAGASLLYEFGRTWSASAEFRRRLELVQGLPQPFFANGFSASLGGLAWRRVGFDGAVGYSQGAVGIEALQNGYTTSTVSGRVFMPLNSHFGVSGDWVYYKYDFTEDVLLPPSVVPALSRQVFRVSLAYGVALIRHR